jgi:hypothetical protein
MYILTPLLSFIRSDHQRNSDFRERLKRINVDEGIEE